MAILPAALGAPSSQELLSVERLRFEFEVPDGSQDSAIGGYIRAAVDWAAQILGGPILDETKTILAPAPQAVEAPVSLSLRFAHTLGSLRYWETTDKRGDAPSGLYAGSALRTSFGESEITIWPPRPAFCWPEMLAEAPVIAEVSAGLDMTAPNAETIVRAVILAAREFQFGVREIGMNSAAYRLLQPLAISVYSPTVEA